MHLSDLSDSAWTPVAHLPERSSDGVEWHWLMSSSEAHALLMARNAGTVYTVQVRAEDGGFDLLARLRKARRR